MTQTPYLDYYLKYKESISRFSIGSIWVSTSSETFINHCPFEITGFDSQRIAYTYTDGFYSFQNCSTFIRELSEGSLILLWDGEGVRPDTITIGGRSYLTIS